MTRQFLFFCWFAAWLPILPLVFLQARRVRAEVPKLPDADGREGEVGCGATSLSILAIGESTVAGVGIRHHRDGFSGWIARHLAAESGATVCWRAHGMSGFTAADVAEKIVPNLPPDKTDLIVVGLGGNDTFRLRTPLRWKRDLERVIVGLRRVHEDCPIIIANMPPIGKFPAFTKLMRLFLGGVVRLHGSVILDLPNRFDRLGYSSSRIRLEHWLELREGRIVIDDLFADGVHPSSLTYEIWMKQIVNLARREWLD